MKIKDVCEKTGLTDRTIRFYIEKGLLQTQSQLVNGRVSREYTEDDISILMDISKLRKAGFSIQDILIMQNPETDINEMIAKHCDALEEEQATRADMISKLREVNKRGKMPWRKLANILFQEPYKNGDLHWPQEELSEETPPIQKKRFKSVIFLIILAVLFLFGITAFQKVTKYRQELVWVFPISDVVVEEKWYENATYYVTLYSTFQDGSLGLEEYFEFSRTLPVDGELYDALVVEEPIYENVNITFRITYGEAEDLELLNEDGNLHTGKVANVILTDILSIKKYCSVTGVRAGGETPIYHYP